MHESGVARAIWQAVDEVRARQGLGRIHRVTIELGEFSGVEAPLLRSAFEDLVTERGDGTPELVIDAAPLEARCDACHHIFPVENFSFRCPQCQSVAVQIIRGEELRLVSVNAERAEVRP